MSSSQSSAEGIIPAMFTWPVLNFSTLTEKDKKIHSANFAIGGHKWRVHLYLKVIGDHIPEVEIYLLGLVTNSSKLPLGWSRDVKFELSVVDQVYGQCSIHKEVHYKFKEGNYNGGFSLFVPIRDLYDPNRDFLLNDTLIVKAGVYLTKVPVIDTLHVKTPASPGGYVNKIPVKDRLVVKTPVSLGKYATGFPANDTLIRRTLISGAQAESIFTWTIVSFSNLAKKHDSDVFLVGGYEWRMTLYPKGYDAPNLGIVLHVANSAKLSRDWSRYVEITFSVVDQVSSRHTLRKEAHHEFHANKTNWGVSLMPLRELRDRSRGFLVNDTLVIEVRLKGEQEEKEYSKKESHIYTIIQVALNKDLLKPIPRESFFDLVDHDNVRGFHTQNWISFRSFKEQVAEEFGVPVQCQRFWLWEKRQNHIYRPCRPLTPEDETQSVGQLRELSNEDDSAELKLFLDVEFGPDLKPIRPPQKTREDILLFFKLYDPIKEELSYVGRIFVKSRSWSSQILAKLNKMAGFSPSQEVELYKDVKFEPTFICEVFDKTLSFGANQVVDGDILYFQKSLSFGNSQHLLYPDVPSFMEFLHNRRVVHFRSLEKPKEEDFALELSQLCSYNVVVERVACVLGLNDPTRVRLTPHNLYTQQPAPTSIEPMRKCHLSDMLVQTSDILYYEVLEPEAGPSTSETQPSAPIAPSSLCVICLEAPLEVACIPCGHMCGCMSCLDEIKAKDMGCPVCRAKIQLLVKIYSA